METVQTSRVSAIIVLFDMQTTFFANAIEGISDEDTHNRLNTQANHIAWLAGSAVHARFDMAGHLGSGEENETAGELFRDNKGIQESTVYPSLAAYKSDWEKITPILRKALIETTDEVLDKKIEMGPGLSMSIFELISFVIYREANLIGQIALWRRLLGYPGMKYM